MRVHEPFADEVAFIMLKRILAVFLFAIIVIPVFPVACNNPEFVEKDSSMVKRTEIPPVDTHTPTVTETATFALG